MTKAARLAAIGILLGNTALVTPAFSQAPTCAVSPTGRSVALQATGAKGAVFSVAGGYHLSVRVNGSDPAGVMVDTGSNALIVPSWKIKGFPADPANDRSGLVVSGKLPYGYSSSANSYNGYIIQVPVTVLGAGGTSVDAENVQVFAITEVCGSDKHCVAATSDNSASVGMMGVGFQPTPGLVVNVAGGTAPATRTNVFQQVPGVETHGWIFEPGGRIVVGLNAETTGDFSAWAPMVPARNGGLSPEGCVRVAEPGKPESQPLCGTMLLDTGMSKMNLWVYSGAQGQAPFCPPPPSDPKPGFDGATFPDQTKITLGSPGKAPALNYQFDATTSPDGKSQASNNSASKGTPDGTYCTNVKGASASENAFFNTGRMPLERYSFARNETCGTFAYRPAN